MVTKIQKWGHSLGVRIPRVLAREARMDAGSPVEISVERGRVVLRPMVARKFRLADLLAGVRTRNVHREVQTGNRRGREIW
jgi:antitoxin MazE